MTRHRSPVRVLLQVSLLGRLDVRTGSGEPVRLGGRHAPALFALLLLGRRPRSREAIAADLWPDSGAISTGALRQALWLVRHGLADAGLDPHDVLEVGPEAIGIRADADIDIDIASFERALDATDDGAEGGVERAIELYRGDLVEALGHDCFAAERERLSDRFEDALVAAAERRLAAGDAIGARRAAEQVLARDPLREEAHVTLIAVHGLIGSRSQVVRQYRRLRVVLARELGEPPLPETDAAYRIAMSRTVRRSLDQAIGTDREMVPALVAVGG